MNHQTESTVLIAACQKIGENCVPFTDHHLEEHVEWIKALADVLACDGCSGTAESTQVRIGELIYEHARAAEVLLKAKQGNPDAPLQEVKR